MKRCPYCAEEIREEAIKCRYCQSEFTTPASTVTDTIPAYDSPRIIHKKIIIPGEKLYFELKPARFNWYWFPVFLCLISLFFPPLFIISLPVIIATDFSYRGRSYAITNKRVIMTVGYFSKQVKECPLQKIQNVNVRIPFASLNTGSIAFDTAGTPFKEIVWEIVKNPREIHQKISSILHT